MKVLVRTLMYLFGYAPKYLRDHRFIRETPDLVRSY